MQGVFGVFDEFVARGATPRSGNPWSAKDTVTPRTGRKVAFPILQQDLEQRLAAWRCGADMALSEARLVALKGYDTAVGAPNSARVGSHAQQVEATLVMYGVEVICLLSVNGTGGRILGARTPCGWPLAQQRIAAAGEESMGQPIEVLLSAVRKRWQDVEEIKLPDILVTTPEKHHKRSSSAGSSRVGSVNSISPRNSGTRGRPKNRRSSSQGSLSRSRSSSPASSAENVSLEPDEPESFGEWLEMKEPLYRLDQCGQCLAWDYPLSKDKKSNPIPAWLKQKMMFIPHPLCWG
jgi:hypothetical protein